MKSLPNPNRFSTPFVEKKKNDIDTALLAEIAIGLWRLKNALISESSNSVALDTSRSWKHLQRLIDRLERAGIRIQDKNGEPYDAGMALRVVYVENRPDLKTPMIVETITPSVFHGDTILHAGEVIIGIPELSQD